MNHLTKRLSACAAFLAAFAVCVFFQAPHTLAASSDDYAPGSYELEAELSCYVNAMGGCEFGGPLLSSVEMTVEEDGSAELTLYLGKSSVTIYSVTCDTFVDASPAYVSEDRGVANGTIGYYDADGELHTEDVTYTLSEDTGLNPNDEEVHYVDSVTFPLDEIRDTYSLTLYVNSNVMGVQFCEPNAAADSATYPATLTVYWDGASEIPEDDEETEVIGEDMDGLTIYRTEESDVTDAEDEEIDAAVTEEESEGNAVSRGLLITLIVIGVVLIVLGALSLIFNITSGRKARQNNKSEAEAHEDHKDEEKTD